MADVSNITVDGVVYQIKDAEARTLIQDLLDGKVKVLKTIEEVLANTNEGYLVSALVIKEIIQWFAGCYIAFEDENGEPKDEPYIHWNEEVPDEED